MHSSVAKLLVVATLGASAVMVSGGVSADRPTDTGRADDVASYWTPQRIAAAQPRDLVIDGRGLGYERGADGSLNPYGHSTPSRLEQVTPASRVPTAKPGGDSERDTTGPSVTMDAPADRAVITATTEDPVSFRTTVTDVSGIRGVTIVLRLPGGSTQSFAANSLGNDLWGTELKGFTPSDQWGWHVVAKDSASRGGNTTTTSTSGFTIDASGDPGPGGDPGTGTVTNERWTGGDVQGAAGRILFEMPTIRGKRVTWNAYVCSGTAVSDQRSDASIILTAAHCVYDDVAKEFAQNVLFIPNQDDGGSDRTDRDCSNDPIGCWAPTNGVVDENWTTRTFPANVEWDYGYYVVPATDAHTGSSSESLEEAVNELTIGFVGATEGDVTHALGYSYSDDPNFMYCAEAMQIETENVNWWLPNCGLSGGSSGGPWVQPMDAAAGTGPIISVNSWGYTTQPGMAGPYLDATAACTFAAANGAPVIQVTSRGIIASC